MMEDLKNAVYGEHASNLGAILAYEIGQNLISRPLSLTRSSLMKWMK